MVGTSVEMNDGSVPFNCRSKSWHCELRLTHYQEAGTEAAKWNSDIVNDFIYRWAFPGLTRVLVLFFAPCMVRANLYTGSRHGFYRSRPTGATAIGTVHAWHIFRVGVDCLTLKIITFNCSNSRAMRGDCRMWAVCVAGHVLNPARSLHQWCLCQT